MEKSKNEQANSNKAIHISILIILLIIVCGFAATVILKYEVEGETDAPFDISKILVVSTAEGVSKENPAAKWDFNINQNNDLYITIEKNKKKNRLIKNVTINNIQFVELPQIGKNQCYRPAETGLFRCEEKYKIDNELNYTGSTSGSLNNLEISNQGGTVIIRFCNENIGTYTSNDQEQVSHDGTLIKSAGITLEQLKAKVQFDVIIETDKKIKYKSTIEVELPVGNIIDEGTSTKELNTDDIILKRM